MTRSDPRDRHPYPSRSRSGFHCAGGNRGAGLAALGLAGAITAFSLTGCGGGGGSTPAVGTGTAATASAASSNPSPAVASTAANGLANSGAVPVPGNTAVNAGSGNGASNDAAGNAGSSASSSAASSLATPARLADFGYYRLGDPAPAGMASLRDGTLALDGRQSSNASLLAGACNGGTAFSICASAASANVFTLCSSDGGGGPDTDRIRSRYVLFDPTAERITDASVLRNLSFSGFENCGQDNVGAQPKSAPSATLSFNAAGDLTLVRYDQDPARSASLPSYFISLDGDTVSGGQAARFNLYRSNGRYLIIATSVPVAGVSASDPGTLIAFVQN